MAIGNFTMATRARYARGFLNSLDDENGVDVTTTVKTTWCGVLWMAKYITKKTLTMEWRTVYTTSAIVSVNGGDAPVQKMVDMLFCLDGYVKHRNTNTRR